MLARRPDQVALAFRRAKPSDQAYVASTWHRSVREDPRLVDAVLDRAGARVHIAHPVGNADRIEGWCCTEKIPGAQLLHMIYVRAERRGCGLATDLLRESGIATSMPLVVTSKQLAPWETRWKIVPMTLTEMLRR